jgi:hypothetical protein
MVSLVSGTIGLIAAVTIVILIRRDHLHVRFGLWWMAVAMALVLLGIYPRAFDQLALLLGVAYGPVLALTLGLTILIIKILTMDIARSHTQARIVRLVQRLAILESELARLKSGLRDDDGPTGE